MAASGLVRIMKDHGFKVIGTMDLLGNFGSSIGCSWMLINTHIGSRGRRYIFTYMKTHKNQPWKCRSIHEIVPWIPWKKAQHSLKGHGRSNPFKSPRDPTEIPPGSDPKIRRKSGDLILVSVASQESWITWKHDMIVPGKHRKVAFFQATGLLLSKGKVEGQN